MVETQRAVGGDAQLLARLRARTARVAIVGIDWARVVGHARLVLDTRNACRGVRVGRERIVKA